MAMVKKKTTKKSTTKKVKTSTKKKSHLDRISIPNYTLGEEIFNAISHGIGAGLAIAALVLMRYDCIIFNVLYISCFIS